MGNRTQMTILSAKARRVAKRVDRPACAVLALIPLAFLLIAMVRYAVDVPFWDHWDFVPFLEKSYQGKLSFFDFWVQHNEHRPLFPRIVMLIVARASGWDVSYELAVTVLLAVGTLAAFAHLAGISRRPIGRRQTCWLLPLASLIVFSLAQSESWLWGWNLMIVMNVCAVVTGIALLASPGFSWLRFVGAVLAGVVATYSFANGLAYWVVVFPVLFLASPSRKLSSALWLAATIVALGSYLYGYYIPSSPPSLWHGGALLQEYARYVLAYLGAPLVSLNLDAAPIEGLLGLIAFCVLIWQSARKGCRLRALAPYLALGLYAISSALITGIGRIGFGSEQAFSPRYVTISSLLWLSIAGLLWMLVPSGTPRHATEHRSTLERIGPLVVLAALALLFGTSSFGALRAFRDRYELLLPARDALIAADTPDADNALLARLYPGVDHLKERLRRAKRYNLSVFRDVPVFCSPDGRPCVTVAGFGPDGGSFDQGTPVDVSIDWLVEQDPGFAAWFRLRVAHDPWLPGCRAVPVVASTYPLVGQTPDDGSQHASSEHSDLPAPAPSLPAGGFHAILPLVLNDYSTTPQLYLLTLPAGLTLPVDAPTGRAQVILEVFGEDGSQWRTSSGEVSLPLFELTITEAGR